MHQEQRNTVPTGRHVPFAQSPLFLFAMNTPCGGCGPISGPTHSIDKQHDRGVSTHLYFCKTREGLAPQFSSFAEHLGTTLVLESAFKHTKHSSTPITSKHVQARPSTLARGLLEMTSTSGMQSAPRLVEITPGIHGMALGNAA